MDQETRGLPRRSRKQVMIKKNTERKQKKKIKTEKKTQKKKNSGKTTLLNVLSMGHAIETLPTVGLNVKIMKKEGVSMKVRFLFLFFFNFFFFSFS